MEKRLKIGKGVSQKGEKSPEKMGKETKKRWKSQNWGKDSKIQDKKPKKGARARWGGGEITPKMGKETRKWGKEPTEEKN